MKNLTENKIVSIYQKWKDTPGSTHADLMLASIAEFCRINGLTAEQREQGQAASSAVPAEIQAVIEAARQWWCERTPKNWDDAELAKAVIRLDGDWPGCPDCSHDCDEPCMPATMQEQLHAVDCHIAQLVHEGKLYPGDGYKPPEGWAPIMPRSKRPTPPAGVPDGWIDAVKEAIQALEVYESLPRHSYPGPPTTALAGLRAMLSAAPQPAAQTQDNNPA